eukprot:scaffold123563_cov51-Phaeocystis_antarctica.AAC.4
MAGVRMDARSYAVTLSALLKAGAEPEALRITRAILDRLEEDEQARLDRHEQQEEQEQEQGQEEEHAWVPWSRRKKEGAEGGEGGEGGEGAGEGRRRPTLRAPLRVDAALCNVMLQVVMRAGEEGESRRVLSRLRAAGLKPSVRTPSLQQPPTPPPSP